MVNSIKRYKNFSIHKKHEGSIILIGNFDGLHLGHQKLFKLAKKFKKKFFLKIGVMTFEPMPKCFLIMIWKTLEYQIKNKNRFIKKFGVDFVITKKFNKEFSKIKSINFIKNIFNSKLKAKFIFVSNNFKFGNNREGNVKQLIKNEFLYNYKIIKPKPLYKNRKIISSSLIRRLLQNGKLSHANKLLNREWSIEGKVLKGRQLGKKIGFPTANIDIKNYVLARPGVYAVKVKKQNSLKFINGIANLGYRPTFNQKKILLEVHLFNFSENLYNKI